MHDAKRDEECRKKLDATCAAIDQLKDTSDCMIDTYDSLPAAIADNVERTPDFTVFQFMENGDAISDSLTFAKLQGDVSILAGAIQQMTQPQDRVVLVFQPGLKFITAFIATISAGRIAVPCYPIVYRDVSRLTTILRNADPSMILCEDSLVARFGEAVAKTGSAVPVRSLTEMHGIEGGWERPGNLADSVAFLQFTSGSTAEPKGVIVTHRSLIHNLSQIRKKFQLVPEDRTIIWLPPYHDMGLVGGLLVPLAFPYPTYLIPPLHFIQRPLRWLKAMTTFHATVSGGPNFAFKHAVDRIRPEDCEGLDLSRIRLLFSGAERIRSETLQNFEQRYAPYGFDPKAFYACYGMAESTLISTGAVAGTGIKVRVHPQLENTYVSCGTSIDDHVLVILNRDTGAECAEGEIGEICLHGPSITAGYYNNPTATESSFVDVPRPDGSTLRMLRTGDLGFLEEGELYVTGRCKEIIIIRGKTYHPQDLEEVAEAADPDIYPNGVASFAVENGEEEQLVLYCEVRRRAIKQFDAKQAREKISAALVRFHGVVPSYIGFVGERTLPRTTSEKLRRLYLRDRHLNKEVEEIPSEL